MFTSRKIVNVKTLVDGQVLYVKAMIKKSYGSMHHPTVIMLKMEYAANLTVVVQ